MAQARRGIEQAERIGVARVIEDFIHRADFDNVASVHGGDAVGDFSGDSEVVADENRAELEFGAHFLEHVENRALGQNIDGGGRLVHDDDLRTQQQAVASSTRWRIPPESSCG